MGVTETGSEYTIPVYGGQYVPVNRVGSPAMPLLPPYPDSAHGPSQNTLTPYGGGYTGTGQRYNSSTGSLSSRSSDETPTQISDDLSTDSVGFQHLSPRSVQSSIP